MPDEQTQHAQTHAKRRGCLRRWGIGCLVVWLVFALGGKYAFRGCAFLAAGKVLQVAGEVMALRSRLVEAKLPTGVIVFDVEATVTRTEAKIAGVETPELAMWLNPSRWFDPKLARNLALNQRVMNPFPPRTLRGSVALLKNTSAVLELAHFVFDEREQVEDLILQVKDLPPRPRDRKLRAEMKRVPLLLRCTNKRNYVQNDHETSLSLLSCTPSGTVEPIVDMIYSYTPDPLLLGKVEEALAGHRTFSIRERFRKELVASNDTTITVTDVSTTVVAVRDSAASAPQRLRSLTIESSEQPRKPEQQRRMREYLGKIGMETALKVVHDFEIQRLIPWVTEVTLAYASPTDTVPTTTSLICYKADEKDPAAKITWVRRDPATHPLAHAAESLARRAGSAAGSALFRDLVAHQCALTDKESSAKPIITTDPKAVTPYGVCVQPAGALLSRKYIVLPCPESAKR